MGVSISAHTYIYVHSCMYVCVGAVFLIMCDNVSAFFFSLQRVLMLSHLLAGAAQPSSAYLTVRQDCLSSVALVCPAASPCVFGQHALHSLCTRLLTGVVDAVEAVPAPIPPLTLCPPPPLTNHSRERSFWVVQWLPLLCMLAPCTRGVPSARASSLEEIFWDLI